MTFIIVFYINYCVLIDRQLFRKHLGRFILMNLLLIVAVDLFQHFWHEIFRLYVMTDLPRKGDGHHGPPAYFFPDVEFYAAGADGRSERGDQNDR